MKEDLINRLKEPNKTFTHIPQDRGIRLPTVMNITGLSKSKIYEAINKGEFPKPVKYFRNGRAVFWSELSINEWLRNILEAA